MKYIEDTEPNTKRATKKNTHKEKKKLNVKYNSKIIRVKEANMNKIKVNKIDKLI